MLYNLAAPADFLSTWWGLTIFILLDIAVLLLIIAGSLGMLGKQIPDGFPYMK